MKHNTLFALLVLQVSVLFPFSHLFAQEDSSFPAFVNNDNIIDKVSLIDGEYWVALGKANFEFSRILRPISPPDGGWVKKRAFDPLQPERTDQIFYLPSGDFEFLDGGPETNARVLDRITVESGEFTLKYSEAAQYSPFEMLAQSIRMDIDRDGRVEWITWDKNFKTETSSLLVYRQSSNDQWVLEATYTPSSYKPSTNFSLIGFIDLCAADFDNDGYIEMYYRSGGEAFIWRWIGPDEYEEYLTGIVGAGKDGVPIITDLDQDSILDITMISTTGSILEGDISSYVSTVEFHEIIDYYDGWKYFMPYDIISNKMIPPGLYQVAVGNIDRDPENEIVFNRNPVTIPTPTDANCYYLDKQISGEYELQTVVSRETGYLNVPVIADIDGDGFNEWIANGISLYADSTPNTPVIRVIDCDANGELY